MNQLDKIILLANKYFKYYIFYKFIHLNFLTEK
jgi:hypothetical protein